MIKGLKKIWTEFFSFLFSITNMAKFNAYDDYPIYYVVGLIGYVNFRQTKKFSPGTGFVSYFNIL